MKKKFIFLCMAGLTALTGCSNISKVKRDYNIPTETEPSIELSDYKLSDSNSIYSLGALACRDNMSIRSACFSDDDTLLIFYLKNDSNDVTVSSLSLKTGLVDDIFQYTVSDASGYYYPSFVSTSPIVINDESNGCYYMYDETNHKVLSYEPDYNSYYSCVYGDGGFYMISKKDSTIVYSDFYNKYSVIYDNPYDEISLNYINSVSDNGNYIIVEGTNDITLENDTYLLSTADDSVLFRDISFIPESLGNKDDYSYELVYEDDAEYIDGLSTSLSGHKKRFTASQILSGSTYKIIDNTLYSCLSDDEKITLSSWNLKDGSGISADSTYLDGRYKNCYIYSSFNNDYYLSPDSEKIVFTIFTEGFYECDLLLWKPADGSNPQSLQLSECDESIDYNPAQYTDYGDLTKRADAIYEKYGLRIVMGQNVPTSFPDYTADIADDYSVMDDALTVIEDALTEYPDKFFDFFTEEYLNGFNIYMCGTFYAAGDSSISNAAGFSVIDQNYECIAVDISYTSTLTATIYHEISHAIFDMINHKELLDDVNYFDEGAWKNLNPDGFEYYNSYLDADGNGYDTTGDTTATGLDYYYTGDVNSVYFIDSYSKTYLTEDLARLMEYDMAMPETEYMSSVHIQEKLNFYYDAIRTVWDTATWPDLTFWEK